MLQYLSPFIIIYSALNIVISRREVRAIKSLVVEKDSFVGYRISQERNLSQERLSPNEAFVTAVPLRESSEAHLHLGDDEFSCLLDHRAQSLNLGKCSVESRWAAIFE